MHLIINDEKYEVISVGESMRDMWDFQLASMTDSEEDRHYGLLILPRDSVVS